MFDVGFPNLGIYIENLKNCFYIGNFSIAFYGIIIGLAIIIGLLLTWKEARRTGQKEDDYTDYIIIGVISGVIGARVYYVVFQWDYYKDHIAEIFNLRSGGLAIYGTIIFAVGALIIFCTMKKKNFFQMIDTMIPQLALAQAMGRWGNFFNMEAFGKYTDGLLAMQLRLEKVNPNMIGADHLEHLLSINGVDYIQATPTFFIESLWCFLLFLFLLWMQRRKSFHGEVFCFYLGLYGLERSIVEGLRSDSLMIGDTGIRVSQLVAVICIALAIAGFFILKKQSKEVKS
ncbi:MAG: prolipoprotein diacylglyceryl transferase [Lachnospiraceae bacterium]|nr:prolipoprotein diacylglyceryl transferase [Lachnospiraceae bacterium]